MIVDCLLIVDGNQYFRRVIAQATCAQVRAFGSGNLIASSKGLLCSTSVSVNKRSIVEHRPTFSLDFLLWLPNSSFWCVPQKSANLPSAVARSWPNSELKHVEIRKAYGISWPSYVMLIRHAIFMLCSYALWPCGHHRRCRCSSPSSTAVCYWDMQATRERKDVAVKFDAVWLDQATLHQYPNG